MTLMDPIWRLVARIRYPMSTPEDVAHALGISLTNFITFDKLLVHISHCLPTRLSKFMAREEAERAFCEVARKERFRSNTLYSFEFSEGKIVFVLTFDDRGLLRRLHMHHHQLPSDHGLEIPLTWEPSALPNLKLSLLSIN